MYCHVVGRVVQEVKMALLVWKRLCNLFVLHHEDVRDVVCKFLPIFPISIFLHSVQVYTLCSRLWRRLNARKGTFVVNLYLHGENLTLIILFYQILVC